MKYKLLPLLIVTFALVLTTRSAFAGDPLGTAFTYQGQLKSSGAAYTGTCDMQFSLYDDFAAGTQIGTTQTLNSVTVTNSLFTVKLDFGTNIFAGEKRYLEIDAREILQRVAQMPILKWNYKTQDARVQHIGPMAQDFYAAFNVGEDEKHITTIDADGVSLAAIQGLNQIVIEQNARITSLENQNAEYARAASELKLFAIGAMFAALLAVGACVYVVRTQVAIANRKA